MEKLTREDGSSPDIVADNIEKLREIFPEVFADGHIDFDALKETLGEHVDDREERYSFTWHGKSRARQIAQMPSTGTLRPCPEESVNWDTTKNIFIEGDNLEVLKLLQKSYHRKVKAIYIDPPYNTGKEFIYPDKWQENLDTYLRYTGQVDGEGLKLSANSETSGRYHTTWLNMMYPRLRLARNLLNEQGVIFVSIDDNETHNLKQLLDEVFGSENWLGTVVWKNATDNNPSQIAVEHEYIHVYSREKASLASAWRTPVSAVKDALIEIGEELASEYHDETELQAAYTNWFRDNKQHLWPLDRYKYIDRYGVYTGSQSVHNPGKEGYRYDVLHPETGEPCKQPLMGYRFPESTMQRLLREGKLLFGKDHNKIIELKVYASEFRDKLASVVSLDGRLGAYDLRRIFPEVSKVFTNPKPVSLLADLLSFTLDDGDLVLDFFAGSAPVSEAVMNLNRKDGKKRRFMLVQLPEPVNEKTDVGKQALSLDLPTIAAIAKERIRRVGASLQSAELDTGVRCFSLDSSNIKLWDADFGSMEADLVEAIDNIKSERSEDDVLYELLLKYGLDLAVRSETRDIDGHSVTVIGAGALVVCLGDDITPEVVSGIASLKDELQPEVMRVVFKDSGFVDDVAKTNAAQILRQAGIDDVKSL
ncbi:site-specific DNA-methyltransferase [bacterium AH-315-N03]|nr:site-specific DNA-methyltransferase [bacterium AH-315-N03]